MKNIHFHHPLAKAKCIAFGDVGFGEEYMKGNITVDIDMADFLAENMATRWFPYFRQNRRWTGRHYDIKPEFYSLMLGESRVYTCANYLFPSANLEQAQEAKQKRHVDWLSLTGGERVLECGFGWGNLSQHIAPHSGQYVGLTISSQQQIAAINANRFSNCNYRLCDWHKHSGQYERFTSICMLEHVGIALMQDFTDWIASQLVTGGIGTLQFISRDTPISEWADKYIFPGAEPPSLNLFMRCLRNSGLSITHQRECGDDYIRTLSDWRDNVAIHRQAILNMGEDEAFLRMFHLYLSGGMATFKTGASQLTQMRFEKR